ncbi:oxidoreductase [Thozetella sp. PMI_491]|nr:oxidoreductase [Thozetella sp. PMI_491]
MITSRAEILEHSSRKSCWVVIEGFAYDVTSFIDLHPGGAGVILRYAGRDATDAFNAHHSSDTLDKYLSPDQRLGPIAEPPEANGTQHASSTDLVALRQKSIRLKSLITIRDFEMAASKLLAPESFACSAPVGLCTEVYRAGADDERTLDWNRLSWKSIRFCPRILCPVHDGVDLSTSILGTKVATPFFVSPAGGGKLAHPTGEVLITKAAGRRGVLQWVSNAAGCSQGEIADARIPGQILYWQIYAMADLAITEKEIRSAIERGYKGFALTVDAIVTGNRERDRRLAIEQELQSSVEGNIDNDDQVVEGGISVTRPALYPHFDWSSSIKWLRSITDLPIAIKGVQSWRDAEMCLGYPEVHPWLSNHGGRQLEGAPSAVDTLLEIHRHCPNVFTKREVIVDGGVTRGTDIVKALCLGAKAVGIGRGFLYSLMYGEKGVSKAINILSHEVATTMALLGVTKVEDLNATYIDSSAVIYAYASRL